MSRVVLAAEADRIQDLIFRSSRLREITGASYALEQFWSAAGTLAQDRFSAARVPVTAGGSFRAEFEGPHARADAERFRRALLDLYALRFGGRLSAAVASEAEIGVAMLRAKAEGDPPGASVHFPYLAPCASCALEPAAPDTGDGRAELTGLCIHCRARALLRDKARSEFRRLIETSVTQISPEALERVRKFGEDEVDPAEVGRLDGRNRVAYLLADGNRFGARFSELAKAGDREAYEAFSRRVSEAGLLALADATARLVARLPEAELRKVSKVPVVPLITGGDDVFALVPAPWAFWFAREFTRAFLERVGPRPADGPEPETAAAAGNGQPDNPLSVSCALVFCKHTFPYRFAHGVGERALDEAKAASRTRPGVSPVRGTELRALTGGAVLGPPGEAGVFALEVSAGRDAVPPLVPVQSLFDHRAALGDLPRKRRHQVGSALEQRAEAAAADVAAHEAGLERLVVRIESRGGAGSGSVRPARERLGPAFVDLLHLWDYLDCPPEADTARDEAPAQAEEVAP